jgi:hypothetical protein
MKNSIQYLNLIVAFISIFFFACQKKDSQITQSKHASIISSKIDVGVGLGNGGLKPNYCKDCGESEDSYYKCNFSKDDCVSMIDEEGYEICPATIINEFSNKKNLDYVVDIDLAYLIRDSFLMKSELGQTYHTYYYHLGKVAYDNNMININTIHNFYQIYTQTINAIDIIYNGSQNSIPFPNTYKNDILNLIDNFRANTLNKETQLILNNIETDIREFSGLTKYQVLHKLKLQ